MVKRIKKKNKCKSKVGVKTKRSGALKLQDRSTELSSLISPVRIPTEEERALAKSQMFPIKISRPNVNPVSSDLIADRIL